MIYGGFVGLTRRISSFPHHRQAVISQISLDFREQILKPGQSPYTIKEIIAFVGILSIEESQRKQFTTQQFGQCIVKIGLSYFNDLKVVKICTGCLTNLMVDDQFRDVLAREKDFYVLIHNILEKYDYSLGILEYCLKLVINSAGNSLAFKNYGAPRFLLKLVFLLFVYQTNWYIILLLIKILRTLVTDDQVANSLVRCSKEYELTNKEFRFVKTIVECIRTVLTPSQDVVIDIILFLSVIL